MASLASGRMLPGMTIGCDATWMPSIQYVSPVTGITRTWSSLSAIKDEAVDVRVWSGIHFRNADEAGRRIGEDVAKWRQRHFFRPVHGHDD